MSVFGKCTEKVLFSPKFAPIPPNFRPKSPNIERGKRRILTIPTQKKKKIFFYHIKKWYFRPISPHFCPISPPLERIRQKKWSFASGFRGPKIALFSPHFLPLFTAEGPKRGKKGSENFGWETPKNPILTEGLQEGIFLGVEKGLFGGPILRGGKMAILGGFAPILGVAGEKKWAFWENGPKMWGGFGGIWG